MRATMGIASRALAWGSKGETGRAVFRIPCGQRQCRRTECSDESACCRPLSCLGPPPPLTPEELRRMAQTDRGLQDELAIAQSLAVTSSLFCTFVFQKLGPEAQQAVKGDKIGQPPALVGI